MDQVSSKKVFRVLNLVIVLLTVVIVAFFVILGMQFFSPVQVDLGDSVIPELVARAGDECTDSEEELAVNNEGDLSNFTRNDLFQSPTPLRDVPMADDTIERIRSRLRLQCIMEMNGESVAYINIEGVGFRQCRVGDVVSDLFTVLEIAANYVQISIVDHAVTLDM